MHEDPRTPESPATAGLHRVRFPEIFRVSLYYGFAGFGGGYSVLAQLRRDLVDRRRWLSAEEFLVLAELSKSLPGTPATSLLALLGQRVGGARGGALAASAFLLPSMALLTLAGAAYGLVEQAQSLSVFFDGMNAAMVGVVGAVTLDLARTALPTWRTAAAAILCGLLLALRILTEPVLAFAAVSIGMIQAAVEGRGRPRPPRTGGKPTDTVLHAVAPVTWKLVGAAGLLAGLVRVFVPIGVLTFGGGLAMIPAIEHMVVTEQHWLGPKAFADAIALGQITPGPVAICATFIGYRVAGVLGALVATVAMFAPAIALALVAGRSVDRFRESPLVAGALRALAPAVIGMLLAATYSLGHAGVHGPVSAGIVLVSFVVLLRFPISPLWPLLGGGAAQMVSHILWHRP